MARSNAAETQSPRPRSRRRTQPAVNPRLYQDLAGIGLALVAGLLTLGLLKPGSAGAFGWGLKLVIQLLVGQMIFVAPLLLLLLAYALVTERYRIVYVSGWLGAAGLLLVTVAGLHLYMWPSGNAYDSTAARGAALLGKAAEESLVSAPDGGLLGAVATTILYPLGLWGSYLALVAIGVAASLLIADMTLMSVAQVMHERSEALRVKRRRRRKEREEEERSSGPRQRALLLDFVADDEEEPSPAKSPSTDEGTVGDTPARPKRRATSRKKRDGDPWLEITGSDYKLPPTKLLNPPERRPARLATEAQANIEVLERTLAEFRIEAQVVEVADGPSVTRYEIRLGEGIRVRKILDLADNLAMSLAAMSVRVEAPIPGKSAIGIEVPKKTAHLVTLRECLEDPSFQEAKGKLTFVLGKDVSGKTRTADLAQMPHLLVAGATNSGKSVCLNTLIASLLFRTHPDELKLILIDPKRVELTLFEGIPHLCHPVIRDVKQAAGILRWVLKEMDRRYTLFNRARTRNIEGYNRKTKDDKLPYLVVIIDELADLMMQEGAEVERLICRLAQLARATGIHLVIATQRPSVDVITGLIKANIPSRIAFAVTSHIDSRTIIDTKGAEKLVGRGDMLFKPLDAAKPIRVQGAFMSEDEVEAVVEYLKGQGKPQFVAQTLGEDHGRYGQESPEDVEDDLFEPVTRFLVTTGHASTSMIQRRFKIGYTRAARLVDMMEGRGIVGALDGAKPRELLMTVDQVDEMFRGRRSHMNRDEEPETAPDPFAAAPTEDAAENSSAAEASSEESDSEDDAPEDGESEEDVAEDGSSEDEAQPDDDEDQYLLTPLEYDEEDDVPRAVGLDIPKRPQVSWGDPD